MPLNMQLTFSLETKFTPSCLLWQARSSNSSNFVQCSVKLIDLSRARHTESRQDKTSKLTSPNPPTYLFFGYHGASDEFVLCLLHLYFLLLRTLSLFFLHVLLLMSQTVLHRPAFTRCQRAWSPRPHSLRL